MPGLLPGCLQQCQGPVGAGRHVQQCVVLSPMQRLPLRHAAAAARVLHRARSSPAAPPGAPAPAPPGRGAPAGTGPGRPCGSWLLQSPPRAPGEGEGRPGVLAPATFAGSVGTRLPRSPAIPAQSWRGSTARPTRAAPTWPIAAMLLGVNQGQPHPAGVWGDTHLGSAPVTGHCGEEPLPRGPHPAPGVGGIAMVTCKGQIRAARAGCGLGGGHQRQVPGGGREWPQCIVGGGSTAVEETPARV